MRQRRSLFDPLTMPDRSSPPKKRKQKKGKKKHKSEIPWGSIALFAGGVVTGVVVYRYLTRREAVQPGQSASAMHNRSARPVATTPAEPVIAPMPKQDQVPCAPVEPPAVLNGVPPTANMAVQPPHEPIAPAPTATNGKAVPIPSSHPMKDGGNATLPQHSQPSLLARTSAPSVPSTLDALPKPPLNTPSARQQRAPRDMVDALTDLAVRAARLCSPPPDQQSPQSLRPPIGGRLRGARRRRDFVAPRMPAPRTTTATPPLRTAGPQSKT